MNINSQVSGLPLATVFNPATESLRRDNYTRAVIPPPVAINPLAAEKGVAGSKDNGKTPAQNNEQVDSSSLKKQANIANASVNDQQSQQQNSSGDNSSDSKERQKQQKTNAKNQLIEQQITSLKRRDQEVKAHESAHASVGGSVTGAPSFSYVRGPDGQSYAVSGEVSVDASPVSGDPQATIIKMQKVNSAALAPIDPSAQDRRVAAQAAKTIISAQSELRDPNNKANTETSVNKPQGLKSGDNAASTENNNKNNFDNIAQKNIATTRTKEVKQRALRIENFYSNINQAYSKEPSFQFQLTA